MIARPERLLARFALLSALTACGALLAAGGCGHRGAGSGANAASSPAEMLAQMSQAYRDATSYEDVGELHIVADGGRQEEPQPFAVAFERPNKIRVHALGAIVVADGRQFRAVTPSLPEQVLVRPGEDPLTLADFSADTMLEQAMRGQLDVVLPQLALLLDADGVRKLAGDGAPTQLPDAEFDGETCYRVAVKGSQGTSVFWISRANHLLRKFEFPLEAIREKFPLTSVWAGFKGARTDKTISPLAFRMEIPPTSKLVRQFVLPGPEAPVPLLGKVAEDFTFVDLRGMPVSRESLAGKIVVLDLWATWCGWCFEGLPLLETVYRKYKDNDRIAILTVCTDEPTVSDEKVRQAFAKFKLTLPIVRDLQHASDKAFELTALPTGVVLGADGSIQDYHVGYDARLAETLPQKLERLLAGENLAQQELDTYRRQQQEYEARLADVLVDAPEGSETGASTAARDSDTPK